MHLNMQRSVNSVTEWCAVRQQPSDESQCPNLTSPDGGTTRISYGLASFRMKERNAAEIVRASEQAMSLVLVDRIVGCVTATQ